MAFIVSYIFALMSLYLGSEINEYRKRVKEMDIIRVLL